MRLNQIALACVRVYRKRFYLFFFLFLSVSKLLVVVSLIRNIHRSAAQHKNFICSLFKHKKELFFFFVSLPIIRYFPNDFSMQFFFLLPICLHLKQGVFAPSEFANVLCCNVPLIKNMAEQFFFI